MSEKLIEIKNIKKSFHGEVVLDIENLYVKNNEFVTLLGPSGCGKTTLLRLLAGFEEPDSGDILFRDICINDIPANKREINTVFQKYALFPHLNVFDNIAFGLRIKNIDKNTIDKEVENVLNIVKLSGLKKRKINQLSGGQQQRVAIARAIINKPKVLLLDEPLAALDLKLRQDMQYELKDMQSKLGITFIYVTHDQEEALTMSDTVVVLNKGKILQIGTPENIYNEPKNRFVADFIGESNIILGIMKKDFLVEIEGKDFDCVDKGFNNNENVYVVIRPEDFIIHSAGKGKIDGIIDDITFKGVHYELIIMVHDREYIVHTTKHYQINDHVSLDVEPDNIHVMVKLK